MKKTLNSSDFNDVRKNTPDIQAFGDGDLFEPLFKVSSESEGWMKSTKAMSIHGVGCLVQVTTQQRNPDGSYAVAEALTFVPGVEIIDELNDQGEVIGRSLMQIIPRTEDCGFGY